MNIKSNVLERKINRSDEILPKLKRDYDLYLKKWSSSSSLLSDGNLQLNIILKVDESSYSDLSSYEDNVSSDDESRFQVIKDKESHLTNNTFPKLSQIIMTLTQHDIATMENNTLLNGGIINIFEKILDSRYKIKNQAIVPTYYFTSLLDHSWEKGPQRYFK